MDWSNHKLKQLRSSQHIMSETHSLSPLPTSLQKKSLQRQDIKKNIEKRRKSIMKSVQFKQARQDHKVKNLFCHI